jgi:predicted nucleotidyltransferase
MVTKSVPGVADREIAEFCRRWKVASLWLFGSGARGELRSDSDLDFMVEFEPGEKWSLWDFVEMSDELAEVVGRDVDLVLKGSIENPYRRESIERDLTLVYQS